MMNTAIYIYVGVLASIERVTCPQQTALIVQFHAKKDIYFYTAKLFRPCYAILTQTQWRLTARKGPRNA